MSVEPRETKSIPDLLGDLMREATDLFRTEGQLIRSELSDKITQLQVGGGSVAAGAICLLVALITLTGALVAAVAKIGEPDIGAGWAATRAPVSVESTIDALRNRMSVGQIFDEVQGYLKEGEVNAMAQNFGRQVRDNPLALGLVGAGIAWLLMGDGVRGAGRRVAERFEGDDEPVPYPNYGSVSGRDVRYAERMPYRVGGSGQMERASFERDRSDEGGPGLADRARDAASSIGDSISGAASSLKDTLSSGASSASSGLSSAAGSVRDAASSVGSNARSYGGDAADAAWRAERAAMDQARSAGNGALHLGRRARRTMLDTLQDEPLVVGAVALAIGAAIGASLPSTRVEDEYLGDVRDRLRDQAYDYGKDAVHSARHVAEETVRAAGEEADAKGLKPTVEGETLAEKVSGVVKTAAETAKSEAKKEGLL